ncbi:hypothetical protein DLM46_29910 [Paraburkholderia lacunae]|uniref:Uncharacterized protein n=1 Tax=Paraburkholderia lacunae TaxID=2211104 RepID=A0A370N0V1_9BURK|nr:hypothetical protein DLM46_29910 [Paraburkholderia lacunae]
MTVHSNFSSAHLPSLASTPAVEKPSAPSSQAVTPQARESAAQPSPSMPAGLVGHSVNTTA